MQCFETLYDVPVTHRLVPVRSRSLGGRIPATYWEHEKYDALGRLVARYESYAESGSRVGGARSGWRKYNAAGHMVQQGTSLPFGLREAA
jgi:hypothetical protein